MMTRENRLSVRLPLELPVRIWWKTNGGEAHEAKGITGNISANGIFVTGRRRLRRRAPISFRVDLPSEVTRIPVQLLGQGRIVRYSGPGEVPGMAAIIDDYEIRPAAL